MVLMSLRTWCGSLNGPTEAVSERHVRSTVTSRLRTLSAMMFGSCGAITAALQRGRKPSMQPQHAEPQAMRAGDLHETEDCG